MQLAQSGEKAADTSHSGEAITVTESAQMGHVYVVLMFFTHQGLCLAIPYHLIPPVLQQHIVSPAILETIRTT
jgi:hypothetical protein